jgi:uncharacterized protein YjbI with pentapeptide repeats
LLFEIKNRFSDSLIFRAETESMKMCVKLAIESGADLRGADLCGANLCSANLCGADLCSANLSGANLSGANLSGANLSGANLSGANLSGANLSGANLRSSYLSGANLSRADLRSADLRSADLRGANLCGADLNGTKYGDGVPMENEPYQLSGEYYSVLILDTHIKIGCELHSHFEWSNFNDEQIQNMDSNALSWWKINREIILALSLHHQQKIANKSN